MVVFFEHLYQKPVFRRLFFTLLFLFGAWTVLSDMDVRPLQNWDESLFAMRAYYWMTHGEIIYNFDYYEGYGYHPNVKPPFTTFFQAPIFKWLGYNELGLRLPMVLITCLCGLSLFLFAERITKSPFAGLFSALVLFTSAGYVTMHAGRTGDQDVATAFYMLLTILFFYLYHQNRGQSGAWRYALAFALALMAAAFTKTIFAFFALPAIFLFILFEKELLWYLRRPLLILLSAGVIGAYVAYVFYMDYLHPGYLEVYLHHAAGRFNVLVDNHVPQPFTYYFANIYKGFIPWVFFLPFPIWALFRKEYQHFHPLLRLLILSTTTLLLIISISKTKLPWYATPFYPQAALLVGLTLEEMRKKALEGQTSPGRLLVVILLFFALFISPYQDVLAQNQRNNLEDNTNQRYTSILKKLRKEKPEYNKFKVWGNPYTPSLSFSATLYNEQYGYEIDVLENDQTFQNGERVLICLLSKHDEIKTRFKTKVLFDSYDCKLYEITSPKAPLPED